MKIRRPLMLAAALFLAAAGAPAPGQSQECPSDLAGAWTGSLPAQSGFLFHFSVTELADGRFEAEVRTGDHVEATPVWQDSGRLRFQPTRHPVAFTGILNEDRSRLAGFVNHATATGIGSTW